MATNQDVIKAFTRFQTASAGNLSTQNGVLFSYDKVIAGAIGNIVHVGMFTAKHDAFISSTTSQHVMAAVRGAQAQGCRVIKVDPEQAEYIFESLRK